MPNKIKASYGGKEVDAVPIEVVQASEQWNSYLLEDQSTIKMKSIVVKILRVDGEYDAEGNPIYLVKSKNVVDVMSPENLRSGK